MFKQKLSNFIKEQLSNMTDNIIKNSKSNLYHRRHNPFNLIDGDAEKYMAVGRSYESQLGNRLQNIAFFLARRKFGKKNVPNIIIIREDKSSLIVETLSYPIDYGMKQYAYWEGNFHDYLKGKLLKTYKKNPECFVREQYVFDNISEDIINKIRGTFANKKNNKSMKNEIPIDLFYIKDDENVYTYEIKSGGRLDTKNKEGNKAEVKLLKQLFCMFKSSTSRFATCYNNKGEGNRPEGAIFNSLDEKEIIIGKNFWEEILPLQEISYDSFISVYIEAFKDVDVSDRIKNEI